jgi:hypothetical protein
MRVVIAAAIVIAMVVLCYFFFAESGSPDAVRIHELQQQISELKAQLAEARGRLASSQIVASQPGANRQTEAASATPALAERMQELTNLVARFEQTSRDLNDRITRSKLNLPTREELRVQTDKARAELDKARNKAQRTLAIARQIAASLNVKISDDALLEPGVSSLLDANPAFVSARTAARADRKLKDDFEQLYSELRFTSAIDAVPFDRQRNRLPP